MQLPEYLTNEMFRYLLVFFRLGTCIMLLPGFGDHFVSPRVRLVLALSISLLATPVIPGLPKLPASYSAALVLIFSEIFIGLMVGSIIKIIGSAIHIAGFTMSMQASLSQTTLFDPNYASQGAVIGTFMEILVLVLLFSLDLHHLLLKGIIGSYEVFPAGGEIHLDEFSEAATTAVSKAFLIGIKLSAPLIIVGLLVNLASGILARLMPSFQVYFVVQSGQILIALYIMLVTLSASIMWYMDYYSDTLSNFLLPS